MANATKTTKLASSLVPGLFESKSGLLKAGVKAEPGSEKLGDRFDTNLGEISKGILLGTAHGGKGERLRLCF